MAAAKGWIGASLAIALVGCTGESTPELPDTLGPDDGPDTPGPDDSPLAIAAGDVVFTELLLESLSCPGGEGAWVELLNRTDQAISIDGWTLGDGVRDVPLAGSGFVASGYAVATQVGGGCQGVSGDLTWPSAAPTLGLKFGPGFRVELKHDGTLIDAVPLDEFEGVAGRSWQVEAGSEGLVSNDDVDAWCLGASPIGSSDDLGSPGVRTPSCGAGTDGGGAPLTVPELDAGDLLITEVMLAPGACAAEVGQWIEVLNLSGRSLDLTDLVLSDGLRTVQPGAGVRLTPGNRALFAAGDASSFCYASELTPQGFYGGLWTLSGAETISVGFGAPFTALDEVSLAGLPQEAGRAVALSANQESASANDDAANWCASDILIPTFADAGTPGDPNAVCPPYVPPPTPTGADLAPGSLIITEVMFDPMKCTRDTDAEYFEVYNATGVDIDLQGLTIDINNSPTTLSRSYPVPAGAWALAEITTGAQIAACYNGLFHDFLWQSTPMSDDGTSIRLIASDTGAVIDTIDLTGYDLTSGAAMQLDAGHLDAVANDDPANWCPASSTFPGSGSDLGNPKQPNEACPVAPVDTDTSPDTPVDTDPPVVPIGANALAVGDLVITELMVDPTDCDDFRAEYIELFNTTDDWIELSALTVTIDGRSSLVWAYPELIPPHEHGLLRYSTLSPPSCYAIGWSGLYSADRMDDTGSTVSVSNARGVLDVVVSGLWTWTPGRAKGLDPLLYDPIANDDPAAWCDATTSFLGSAYDLGSPYALNTPCPVAPVDTGGVDTDVPPVVLPPLQVADLRPGDFVITELIVDPNDCDDFRAEYIEFWNTTGRDVDLTGLDVQVDGARSTLRSTAELVRADAFGVLRYSTLSPPTCYSLGWNGLYSAAKMGSGGSTVSLIAPAGVIDTVAAVGWSHQASVSKQLDPAWFDASSNDDPAHWCDSSTVIFGGFSDLGTPGLPNLTCGGAIDTAGAVDTFVAVETSPPTDTYYTGLAGDLLPAPTPAPVGLRGWLDAWVAWLGL